MTAREHAATIQPGSGVKWRALELAAFERHPGILRVLDPSGKYGKRGGGSNRALLLAAPFMLLAFALYVGPIWGLATVMEWRFGQADSDPAVVIPAAGIIFLVTLPFLVLSAVVWWRRGRTPDRFLDYQAGIALFIGGLTVVLATARAIRGDVPAWPLWVLPILAVTIVGGVFFVALLRARRAVRATVPAAKGQARVGAVEPLKAVREQVERLPAPEREAIQQDLLGALDDLERREVIKPAEAEWARGAELGKLALRMSQPRKPSRTTAD